MVQEPGQRGTAGSWSRQCCAACHDLSNRNLTQPLPSTCSPCTGPRANPDHCSHHLCASMCFWAHTLPSSEQPLSHPAPPDLPPYCCGRTVIPAPCSLWSHYLSSYFNGSLQSWAQVPAWFCVPRPRQCSPGHRRWMRSRQAWSESG